MIKGTPKRLALYAEHIDKWKKCKLCKIGSFSQKHVFGRGTLPCDILFIGEGPGKLEDILGEPFVGLAGRLLDEAIERAGKRYPVSYFITNIVSCRPCDGRGESNRAPTQGEVKNCENRLASLMRIANPPKIILLGKTASSYFKKSWYTGNVKVYEMVHPAWILRQGGNKSDVFKQFTRQIRKVFKSV